jgi:hypothetical protein
MYGCGRRTRHDVKRAPRLGGYFQCAVRGEEAFVFDDLDALPKDR